MRLFIPDLFFLYYFFSFWCHLQTCVNLKWLPKVGFELRISDVGSNRSANCVTTTASRFSCFHGYLMGLIPVTTNYFFTQKPSPLCLRTQKNNWIKEKNAFSALHVAPTLHLKAKCSVRTISSMRLHQLVGGSTGPGCSLLHFLWRGNIFNYQKQPSFYLG